MISSLVIISLLALTGDCKIQVLVFKSQFLKIYSYEEIPFCVLVLSLMLCNNFQIKVFYDILHFLDLYS